MTEPILADTNVPDVPTPDVPTARPYRSHKIPACDFCHRRKTRCVRLRTDEACVLCRSYQMPCETGTDSRSRGPAEGKRRRREAARPAERPSTQPQPPAPPHSPPSVAPASAASLSATPATTTTPAATAQSSAAAALNQASHIVGPATARDAQVLGNYISPTYSSTVSHARPNHYSVYSDDPQNPVVYMKVPRQRGIDPSGNGTCGFKQCENIEKILQPLMADVFALYFDTVHPPFPILDKASVVHAYQQGGLPHTLVCEIYAVALVYWPLSARIRAAGRPVPDTRYIWNLTVSAMREDFAQPSFSTVLASILDLLGRPITSITYNAINVGSTVALANSLGLNRDPARWNLDRRQKSLRVRAWWCLLIHDHWASLSHGTPSHIHSDQYDVALPDIDALVVGSPSGDGSDAAVHRQGAQAFLALCQLTQILGMVLPLVYALGPQQTREAHRRVLRRVEAALDAWEDGLPGFLAPAGSDLERHAPGALNLQLSFLAVKMLLCRVAVQTSSPADPEDVQYHQARHRKAATAVIDFATSLTPDDLVQFWLPYTAYHLTSAAILTLRCALEAPDERGARACIVRAKGLVDYLRHLKDTANWDLADICLGQCEAIATQMSASSFADLQARRLPPTVARDGDAADALPAGSSDRTASSMGDATGDNTMEGVDRSGFMPTHTPFALSAMGHGNGSLDYILENDFFSTFWDSTYG